jgi:hypothetical protein
MSLTRGALLTFAGLLCLDAAAAPPRTFERNNAPTGGRPRPIATPGTEGGGLAPTTWGFAAGYSGTLYGTGYYAFQVDQTYAGTNSVYGYTFNYPAYGFVNDVRAVYAFDVSGLAAGPAPLWSSFLFDTREAPPAGSSGVSAFAEIALVSSGGTHRLQGLSLFIGNGATNLDIYDAEDFENAAPFDNPELAFSGNNPLIGTFPVTTDVIVPIDFDVTDAVEGDLPPPAPTPNVLEIPTVGTWGLMALGLLLAGFGAVILRR